ncbi:isochorismatase family protein [Corynebacterium sp. zg-331]|uniref:isochorismatase family protein n=1 Tax=unclassified Corynebacterium TaxID=2624378 RepID=UPI00128CE1D2|nr:MULTISPECIES: isochorismatase family protein [unclassified Corynebacterium]MBC3186600.1 isochorismatase family protein [Corynebacterium sp. zg-331]MPV53084.1 isochorismatase family protein [Corynebacterium sp. zg331]
MPIPSIAPYTIPAPPTAHAVTWTPRPRASALLVHDMQRYFLDAYPAEESPASTVIPRIRALIDAADAAGIPVFYSVQPPCQQEYRRGLLREFWGEGMQTAREAEVIAALTPREHHHVLTKWRYSALQRTDLRQALAYAGRDELIITGVYGHMGCMMTAAEAFMNDVRAFVLRDAIADFTAEDHQRTLDWVARRCGRVLDTDDVLRAWTATP